MFAEHFAVALPGARAPFGEVQPDDAVEVGVAGRGAVEDIAREPAVACRGFDQVERLAPSHALPHLDELRGQQFAEHRAQVHAREEIAPAARPLLRARVVAERFVIERLLDELPHGHRAVVVDAIEDEGEQGGGHGSGSRGTSGW